MTDTYLDDPAIRAAFAAEADEHLGALEHGLLQLEQAGADDELLRTLLRSAHTLKASARLFRLEAAGDLAHRLEESLIRLQRGVARPDAVQVGALLRAVDALRTALGPPTGEPAEVAELGVPEPTAPAAARTSEYVRIPAARLEAVFNMAEGWARLLQDARRHGEHLAKLVAEVATLRRALLVDLGDPPRPASETLRTQAAQAQMAAEVVLREQRALQRSLSEQATELQARVGELHLRPLSSVLGPLVRGVREEATRQGKEVALVVRGDEVELDDHVLQGLSEPLTHLVRNALDHGIEPPAERLLNGKPSQGAIAITTQVRADTAIIEVRDDGRGVDLAQVREQALRRGLLPPAAAQEASADELLALIFQSGFTTRVTADAISGRGIGLDIVHERVGRLGGRVTIETAPRQGTVFRLAVPLAASTTRVLVVASGGVQYAVPTALARGVTRSAPADLPVIDLAPAGDGADFFVLLGEHAPAAALRADAVLSETSAVLRPFNVALGRPPFISGVALRPDGSVALVLDPAELLAHRGLLVTPRRALAAGDAGLRAWSREALRAAGWAVVGAGHGHQALAMALHGGFGLVLAAADLPGVDGLALARLLRAEPRTAHVPVVLVGPADESLRDAALAAGARAIVDRGPAGRAALHRVMSDE